MSLDTARRYRPTVAHRARTQVARSGAGTDRDRFRRSILAAFVTLALCGVLAPARVGATEEPAEATDDGTITTVLQPGWNMVGWLGESIDAREIFDEVPNLERLTAWDGEHQRYQRRTRNSISRFGLTRLEPGRGLFVFIGGDESVEWTREVSEESMLLELQAGRNLVGWAGRDGTPIEDAVARFGDTFVRASLWDASARRFLRYRVGEESAHSLRELNHGDALWVELTEDARWWQSGAAPPPVVFLGEFPEAEQAVIGEWADHARAVYAERWAVGAPITIYVGDLESVTPTYRRIRGTDVPNLSCGNYFDNVIFLWGGCVAAYAIAHDYFHAIQDELSMSRYYAAPNWMIEGPAEYAGVVYAATLNPFLTVNEAVEQRVASLKAQVSLHDWPRLSAIEAFDKFHGLEGGVLGYWLGFLAVDWLIDHSDELSVISFFERQPGRHWEEAFELAFGMDAGDFEQQFEAYLATPDPERPDPASPSAHD